MFKQSRKKIILSIMGSLILLFALTMGVILLTSYRDLNRRNSIMMSHYAFSYRLDPKPGAEERPGKENDQNDERFGPGPEQIPGYRQSTFYSVAFSNNDGSVLKIDNDKRIYSDEELVGLAQNIPLQGKSYGRTGNFDYIVTGIGLDATLVVFTDNTLTVNSIKTMLHNALIFGGAALVVLFFLSLWLSKRIIRPLEENDRKQKQFISDASHELKTPVAVIDTNAELLSREIGENEWLANIRYENDRMGGLVKQLLDLSRAENAALPKEKADLSRVVTGEVLAFESLAFDRGKTLRSEIADGIALSGSETQLAQLVSVLLDNAVRHSTGGEIGIFLKREGHEAVLEVENEGEAIPPEKLAHLFDRFYRADEARSEGEQHYGLGLAIAKAVAERHGGSIGVSCADGKVRFTARLPLQKN